MPQTRGRTRLPAWLSTAAWPGAADVDAQIPRVVASGRIMLTALGLAAAPVLPGFTHDERLRFALWLVLCWLPAATIQLLVSMRWHRLSLRLFSMMVDVAMFAGLMGLVPGLRVFHYTGLIVFVGLHTLLDAYLGGLVFSLLASTMLLMAPPAVMPPESAVSDSAMFALVAVSTTFLLGWVARAQRSAALRLAESHARTRDQLTLALDAANTGLWDWDLRENRLEWSTNTKRIFGVREEPSGFQAYLELVQPEDRKSVEDRVNQALAHGDVYQTEHRILRAGGERWVFAAGRVLRDPDGQPIRLLGVITDVTEQRQQRQQLERARRMDTVSGLAGGFAHDFNNLLAVISMTAEVHRRSPLDAEQQQRVLEIIEAARRGAELSSKLLTFARREPGHPTALRLSRLISEVEPLLAQALREDISLTVDVPPDLTVLADRTLLEQALLNLAMNARDAVPGAGRVLITAFREPSEASPRRVVLEVADDGVGMTDDVRERALEPFFTTKPPDRGTGLGLASVYSTVTAIGGDVEIESALGRGTTIRLRLPSTAEDPGEDRTERPMGRSGRPAHVLIVDDDAGIRRTLTRLLNSNGHLTVVAANGHEALRALERDPTIELLITDVVMPEMSGPELVKQLHRQGIDLPVVYMTGYVDRYMNDLPATSRVLHKPFSSDELRSCVAQALPTTG